MRSRLPWIIVCASFLISWTPSLFFFPQEHKLLYPLVGIGVWEFRISISIVIGVLLTFFGVFAALVIWKNSIQGAIVFAILLLVSTAFSAFGMLLGFTGV